MTGSNPLQRTMLLAALLGGLVALALGFLIFRLEVLGNRVRELETTVARREEVDPLTPPECEYAVGTCSVPLARLISAPQQFHGRRVTVTGVYLTGEEMSAIYELNAHDIRSRNGIWIEHGLPRDYHGRIVTLTGRFKRGPAGHMLEYGGELDDVRVVIVEK